MAVGKLTLSVEETAQLLGIGRQLCYDQVKSGQIPSIRMGRRLLVLRRPLERLLEGGMALDGGDNNGEEYDGD